MISLDFGANDKLCAHGPDGPITIPSPPRGLCAHDAEKFAYQLEWLLIRDDVVLESPTVGSSGAESETIYKIVERSPHNLYTVSARRFKNWLKDHGLTKADLDDPDVKAAEVIYEIAIRPNAELKLWQMPTDRLKRRHTSVRPYDKRKYKDPVVDEWMSWLPAFDSLPEHMQEYFTNGLKRKPDYSRARVLPFAMALEEDGSDSRRGYEHVIGLSESGYPSFYRRATVNLMQYIAKIQAAKAGVKGSGANGNIMNADITPTMRKAAWRETRRVIRQLYSMT